MTLLVVLFLATVPGAGTPRPKIDTVAEAATLRNEATEAYKARRYAEACPLFAKARALAPHDFGLASDLGLCLLRQGKKAEARTALEDAVRLTLENERSTNRLPDAPKVRKAAAFNLALLGEDLAPAKGCAVLPPSRGCGTPAHICVSGYSVRDGDGEMSGRLAVLHSEASSAEDHAKTSSAGISDCSNDRYPFRCALSELAADGVLELSADDFSPRTGTPSPLRRCRLLSVNACDKRFFTACTDPGTGRTKERIDERTFH
jgi:tetratricopeptide (TPR) repeat protein